MSTGVKVVIILMLVMLFGVFHIIFTMFDYGFNNPDSGAFTLLEEQMNETLSGDYQSDAYNNTVMMQQFFGVGRVVILAVIVIAIGVLIVDRPNVGGN